MYNSLENTISKLDEETFTTSIVIPLISKIHKNSRAEYTHSPLEAGRDVVSVGEDILGRPNIICIQVKATSISYGAAEFGRLSNIASVALKQGVTLQDGSTVQPNEFWIISSQSFPEQNRRQVDGLLKKMSSENIKIIAMEELRKLIIDKIPEIATKFSTYADSKSAELISLFSGHAESKIFGLGIEKKIEDFYIPITLAPNASYTNAVLYGEWLVKKVKKDINIPILELFTMDEIMSHLNINKYDYFERINRFLENSNLKTNSPCKINFEICELDEYFKDKIDDLNLVIKKHEEDHDSESKNNEDSVKKHKEKIYSYSFTILVQYNYDTTLNNLIDETKNTINKCPKILGANTTKFKHTYRQIFLLDDYLKYLHNNHLIQLEAILENKSILRIGVLEPINILKLSPIILLEGPPGSGKTTFLRILSIKLLDKGKKILYIPCSRINSKHLKYSLKKIVTELSFGEVSKSWKFKECVLILDGLDEASFDLTKKIIKGKVLFKQIILSARRAFKTQIRDIAFNIGITDFNEEDRDLFFEKWFNYETESINTINELIKLHKDIDNNTRVPLIATITASLIEKKYQPTTRAEIYDFRLQLLLSKWDKSRGIKRYLIDNPTAKSRFLRQLAFNVHNSPERNRIFTIDSITEAYSQSLGNYGYLNQPDHLLSDLIASGIIIKEFTHQYSFGHLSFQEHLVGEYLTNKNINPKKFMNSDWWREPLLFYSSIKGDLTELIQTISADFTIYFDIDLLLEMIKYAPYTSPGAVDSINELKKNAVKNFDEFDNFPEEEFKEFDNFEEESDEE